MSVKVLAHGVNNRVERQRYAATDVAFPYKYGPDFPRGCYSSTCVQGLSCLSPSSGRVQVHSDAHMTQFSVQHFTW
jgi:hypothetical protein